MLFLFYNMLNHAYSTWIQWLQFKTVMLFLNPFNLYAYPCMFFLGFFFFFLYIYTPPWQRMVIKTKSVKYMPFYLSLANFTNGLIWVIYGLLDFDINLVVGHHRTETNFCFFFFSCKLSSVNHEKIVCWSFDSFPMAWVRYLGWFSSYSMESTADRPNRMMMMMLVETDLWLNSPLLSLHNTVSGHLSCFNRQFAGRAWFQD
jgi:hypothetical protein